MWHPGQGADETVRHPAVSRAQPPANLSEPSGFKFRGHRRGNQRQRDHLSRSVYWSNVYARRTLHSAYAKRYSNNAKDRRAAGRLG